MAEGKHLFIMIAPESFLYALERVEAGETAIAVMQECLDVAYATTEEDKE